MMAPRFLPVDEAEVVDHPAKDNAEAARATEMMVLALKALSQRTIVAIANLYAVILAGTAFWLFMSVVQNPSVLQLIGAGMYGVFVLAVIWMRRN